MPSLGFRKEGFNEEESGNPRPNGFVFSIVRKTLVEIAKLRGIYMT